MRPRLTQHYTIDLSNGEPGLMVRHVGESEGRTVVFVFESDDEDGIQWFGPGFDNPLDAAMSNKTEYGAVRTDTDAIVRIDRSDSDDAVEIVRIAPESPDSKSAKINTRDFLSSIGDEPIERARRRAFHTALDVHGLGNRSERPI